MQNINKVPNFDLGTVKLSDYGFLAPQGTPSANQNCQHDPSTNHNAQIVPSTNQNISCKTSFVLTNDIQAQPALDLKTSLDGREREDVLVEGEERSVIVGGACDDHSVTVAPSTESQCDESASGKAVGAAPTKKVEHSITIVKYDEYVKLYPSNIESLLKRRKINLVCSTISASQCIEYFRSNLLDCKLAIAKCVSNSET